MRSQALAGGSRWAGALLLCLLASFALDARTPLLGSEPPEPAPVLSAPSAPAFPAAPDRPPSASSRRSTREVDGADDASPQPLCGPEDIKSLAGRFARLLNETQVQRAQKLDELRAQIDALADLLARPTKPRQTGAAESPPPRESSGNADQAGAPAPPPSSPVPPRAVPPSGSPTATAALTAGNPPARSPADRLHLANNLFGAGDIELALELYQGLRQEDLDDADQRWVRYQIATCHRRLGSTDMAEQLYREVASANDGDPTAAGARWWLDVIARRNRLEEGLRGLDEAITTMEREIHEPPDD